MICDATALSYARLRAPGISVQSGKYVLRLVGLKGDPGDVGWVCPEGRAYTRSKVSHRKLVAEETVSPLFLA